MAYKQINLNPEQKRVGDCTVRAIAAATHQEWAAVYAALALAGFELHDMPSANYVWGSYLRRCGWNRSAIPNSCPDCYTVADFAAEHPDGTYILAMATHVVAVVDGVWRTVSARIRTGILPDGAADAVGHARSAYTAPASGISAAATGTAKLAYYLGAR